MTKAPVEIRDLLTFRFPENLQYSTKGTYLAFQVAQANEKKNSYDRDVWLVRDGKAKQLTATLNTSIVGWDDDTTLIVTRSTPDDEPGVTNLYRLDVNGGEAQKWISLPFVLKGLKKVANNVYVAAGFIDANDPDAYKDNAETRKKKLEALKAEEDYHVVDEVPYWFNGAGYINKKRTALFTVRTGKETTVKRITAPKFDMGEMVVEGKTVFFNGNLRDNKRSMFDKLYAFNTETGKTETLYGRNDHSIGGLFVLKGELYFQATDMKTYGINETGKISHLVDKKIVAVKDPERQLHNGGAVDISLGGGSQSKVYNNAYYTLATNEDHVEIWKFDSAMRKTVLFDEQGAVFFMDAANKKIAFARATESSLMEVYEMDTDGKNVVRLTNLNDAALKDKYVAKPHRIDYTSGEDNLHGWVLLPQNFDTKKKYPAVLDIHGGPRAVYTNAFFHEMQVWASKGYVVFFTNIRGSDGRGDEFADIRDKYGSVDFDNLMDFTDAVLAKYPNIDPKRVCETGGSYGGFMTNWIIGHTDRFCCAASQRSIANWVSFTFISDIGLYFGPDQCGAKGLFGDVNTEFLWNHSPLKYAENVKTPTLFIHSDEDFRCPLPEGMQMMQALAVRDIETRLVIFKGENHELSRSGKPVHRIRRLDEITGWFEKHAK
ncbi:MAG: S9 family peptidase [Erysipelotrichaceae bacterium]|nr:S9 family peptidase [Erysipelotrichaceae bacterium]